MAKNHLEVLLSTGWITAEDDLTKNWAFSAYTGLIAEKHKYEQLQIEF